MTIDQAVERQHTIPSQTASFLLMVISSGDMRMEEAMFLAFPEEAKGIYSVDRVWGTPPPPER